MILGSDMPAFDIKSFPLPVVSQPLDYEATKNLRLDDYVARMNAAGHNYDVQGLEGDPAVSAAESAAKGDLYYQDMLNHSARVTLLSHFAEGPDLDLHVKRSGIERLEDEQDPSLQERHRLAQKGKSAAGPDHYYIARARAVSARVRDVAIAPPVIRDHSTVVLRMSILTHDNGGVPDQALLDEISAVVNAPDFVKRGVVIEVVPAVIDVVDVRFVLWLYRDGVAPVDPDIKLINAFREAQRLDFDLTDSWIKSVLHVPGVQLVDLPDWQNHFAAFDRALALGQVSYEVRRAEV